MRALDIYKDNYEEQCTHFEDRYTKYEWAASDIFDLVTYDGGLDEMFVKDILEVCKVILERSTYEYIGNHECYVKYILVCQLLNTFKWIDWGTSIRGAWFSTTFMMPLESEQFKPRNILEEYKWWSFEDGHKIDHVIDAVPFTIDNLKDLIAFMEEEP